MKPILILSGLTKTTTAFQSFDGVETKSFQELWYTTTDNTISCYLDDVALDSVAGVYMRVVGPYREHAAIIAWYCKQKNIPVYDHIYEKNNLGLIPIFKGIETLLHITNNIPIPKTAFCTIKNMQHVIHEHFDFPVVIKDTEGIKGRNAYSPTNKKELDEVITKIKSLEKPYTKKFLVQDFIKASTRERLFVIGDEVIAGMRHPMRWRERFFDAKHGDVEKKLLNNISDHKKDLAIRAAKSAQLDIAGIDLIEEDATQQCYIMEANAEPEWGALVAAGVPIEQHITNYLKQKTNRY